MKRLGHFFSGIGWGIAIAICFMPIMFWFKVNTIFLLGILNTLIDNRIFLEKRIKKTK